MEATWVGGPWDGRTDELPPYIHEVAVAVNVAPSPTMDDGLLFTPYPDYRELRLPVVQTMLGARIFWHEP